MPKPARRRAASAHYGEIARLGRALASPVRLRLVDLLRQGPRTVDVLAEAAGENLANCSRHLQQLRAARLVEADRQGRHIRYRLTDAGVSAAFAQLRGLAEALFPEMTRLRRELQVLEPAERERLLAGLRRGRLTLVDVRPAEEYQAGHLPGARSLPLRELPRRLGELPRSRPVVVSCRGPYCHMALDAVELLRAAGFEARHLDLGFVDVPAPALAALARSTRPITPKKRMPR